MAFEEIGTPRRRHLRPQVAPPLTDAVVVQLRPADDVVVALPDGEEVFSCEGCRRELPLSDRSRIIRSRCRACV